MTRPRPRWTDAQVAYLLTHTDETAEQVAAAIGRTAISVNAKRGELIKRGELGRRREPYTDAELELLADTTLPDTEVARRLGRTVAVVRLSRQQRGIPLVGVRPKRRWTDDEIAVLVAMQDRPLADQAARLGRTRKAVQMAREALIREGTVTDRRGRR